MAGVAAGKKEASRAMASKTPITRGCLVRDRPVAPLTTGGFLERPFFELLLVFFCFGWANFKGQ